MKRYLSVLFATLAIAGAVAVAAQDKPNFVGTWKLSDPAAPDQFTPSVITVAQDATNLTVTTAGQMGEFKTAYKLDGTEGRSPLDFNGTTIDRMAKLTWEGKNLILSVKSEANGQVIEFKSVWSLDATGTLSTVTTFPDFQGGGSPITAKAKYKKG
jgi:hypothetical protein